MIKKPTILSLCDYTGTWSQPYQRHYDVIQVDLQHGHDIRLFKYLEHTQVEGIIAQPPCDHFAGSGARWWAGKGDDALIEGLSLVDACLRIIAAHNPRWWVMENPVGRLRDYIGAPKMYYHPYQYAKWADDPYSEAYTKKTCLWGRLTRNYRKMASLLILIRTTPSTFALRGPSGRTSGARRRRVSPERSIMRTIRWRWPVITSLIWPIKQYSVLYGAL
jgi:hypothetical protein